VRRALVKQFAEGGSGRPRVPARGFMRVIAWSWAFRLGASAAGREGPWSTTCGNVPLHGFLLQLKHRHSLSYTVWHISRAGTGVNSTLGSLKTVKIS